MRYLQCSIQLLPIHRQLHTLRYHSLESNSYSLLRSDRHILEGMLEKTLLLEFFNEGGVHIEIDGGIMPWKIKIKITKYLFFYGYWIKQKFKIRMTSKIFNISNIQSPSYFSRKTIIGQVQFFKGRIECKYYILLYGLCGGIINHIM